jgi:hypothetical protein
MNPRILRLLSVFSLAWLMAACGAVVRPPGDGGVLPDTGVMDGGVRCIGPGGRVIPAGESFFDGCNTCFCGTDGNLACTARACVDARPPVSCTMPDGTTIGAGSTWTSRDGCTVCGCEFDGTSSCAMRSDCFDAGPPPPPPACIAPDMTPLPVGGSWASRDGCTQCTCTPRGLSCATNPRCVGPDAGPPVVCRAPDGSALPVGGSWRSPDGCTACVCDRSGSLACSRDPRCVPDAGVACVDRGGRPIPVGACFADTCESCCCTAMGLSCRPSGAPGCTDAGVPPGECNAIPGSTVSVTARTNPGVPPAATGGTILDGYYTLREFTMYGSSSVPGVTLRYAVQVTRGAMNFVVDTAGSPQLRANFSYVFGGTLIRLTPTCGMGGPGSGQFSARADGFELFIDSGSPGQVQRMLFLR